MKRGKAAARLGVLLICCLSLAACEFISAQTIPDNGQNQSQGQGQGQFQGQFQGQGQGKMERKP